MTRLQRARAIAACDCERTGVARVSERAADWAAEFEHWNTPDAGHLIAASLALDGYPTSTKKNPPGTLHGGTR